MAEVDVLLPVRGARRTLPSALGDVLAQRGVDLRVLAIVDDDDGSRDWLRRQRDPRLLVLDGPRRGPGAALDLGLAHVTAPLLAHMEADDRCPPDRLLSLSRALRDDAVVSRVAQFGARTPGMRRYLDWQNALLSHEEMARERWVEIPALHQTGLYRTEAVRAVGGYAPQGAWPLDIDFWLRWFAAGKRLHKVPRVLYRWRQHPRQSTRGPTHSLTALRACKAHDLVRQLRGPITLVSTGRTLQDWTAALSGLADLSSFSWTPGQPPPPARGVVLAAYGTPRVREALRRALPGHDVIPIA